MKKTSILILLAALMVSGLWSCKKDEYKVYFEGGTAPVLTSTAVTTIPLTFATKDNIATKLSWTNPDYKFTTGVSSQDVAYEIQIDTAGANFTNPKKKSLSISKELSYTFTQTELNDYLLNTMELKPAMEHNLEIRVKSALGQNKDAAILYSNVLKIKATPYAIPPKVTPPSSGMLYIVGSGAGSWDNPVANATKQTFTKLSPTKFELTLPMVGGGSYLFLPVNGSWDTKYGGMGANNTNNVNGDDFKLGGGDLLAPAASGTYKITVDFQTGKFTVVLL